MVLPEAPASPPAPELLEIAPPELVEPLLPPPLPLDALPPDELLPDELPEPLVEPPPPLEVPLAPELLPEGAPLLAFPPLPQAPAQTHRGRTAQGHGKRYFIGTPRRWRRAASTAEPIAEVANRRESLDGGPQKE
jgi:hypothetical protein